MNKQAIIKLILDEERQKYELRAKLLQNLAALGVTSSQLSEVEFRELSYPELNRLRNELRDNEIGLNKGFKSVHCAIRSTPKRGNKS